MDPVTIGTLLTGAVTAGKLAWDVGKSIVGWFNKTPEGLKAPITNFPEIPPEDLPGMAHVKGPGGETFSFLEQLSQPQKDIQKEAQGEISPLLQQLKGGLDFGPIAQEARTQFGEQIVPSIAERFTGMGQGAQSTEAFKRSLGTAGAGLERGLAAEQAKMGSQQQVLQQGLLNTLLGLAFKPKQEALMTPRQPAWYEGFAAPAGQAAGIAGGQMAGEAGKIAMRKLFGGS